MSENPHIHESYKNATQANLFRSITGGISGYIAGNAVAREMLEKNQNTKLLALGGLSLFAAIIANDRYHFHLTSAISMYNDEPKRLTRHQTKKTKRLHLNLFVNNIKIAYTF